MGTHEIVDSSSPSRFLATCDLDICARYGKQAKGAFKELAIFFESAFAFWGWIFVHLPVKRLLTGFFCSFFSFCRKFI